MEWAYMCTDKILVKSGNLLLNNLQCIYCNVQCYLIGRPQQSYNLVLCHHRTKKPKQLEMTSRCSAQLRLCDIISEILIEWHTDFLFFLLYSGGHYSNFNTITFVTFSLWRYNGTCSTFWGKESNYMLAGGLCITVLWAPEDLYIHSFVVLCVVFSSGNNINYLGMSMLTSTHGVESLSYFSNCCHVILSALEGGTMLNLNNLRKWFGGGRASFLTSHTPCFHCL